MYRTLYIVQESAVKVTTYERPIRARIFKRLWSRGIDSKEWIPPAYVAWRAGTITLFLFAPIDCLKIPAQLQKCKKIVIKIRTYPLSISPSFYKEKSIRDCSAQYMLLSILSSWYFVKHRSKLCTNYGTSQPRYKYTHRYFVEGRGEGGERGDMPICVWQGFAWIR